MAKDNQSKNKRDKFVNSKSSPKYIYLAVGAIALIVIAVIVSFTGTGGRDTATQPTSEEARYIGRFLPAGYEPVKLTEPITYDRNYEMAQIAPEIRDGKIQFDAGDVIKNRIIYFEYTRPSDNQVIPMMAYIKPSGKLFTGVSYCPPCQGRYHHLEPDGTLTCNSCSTKRNPETEAGISGACKLYPADEIAHELVDGKVQLSETDLANWASQPLDRPVG